MPGPDLTPTPARVRSACRCPAQSTLYADTSRGRRPGFTRAAPPAVAEPLVERFCELLRERGFTVASGRFGALMDVELTNHGPVTIVLSTDAWT